MCIDRSTIESERSVECVHRGLHANVCERAHSEKLTRNGRVNANDFLWRE